MDAVCKSCRFYRSVDDEAGQCRRYPPDNYPDDDGIDVAAFRVTMSAWWCGEFARALNA